jgi:hypothetical protein
MTYVYFNSDDEVLAVSVSPVDISEIPGCVRRIDNGPDGYLRGKLSAQDFWHKLISGDGSQAADYGVVYDLAKCRAERNAQIDLRTREIIALGAPYDGHNFSMEYGDQLSYIALCLAVMAGQASYPIEVRDMVDAPYYLADAATYYTFFFTGLGYVQAVLAGGRVLKDQVNACTTVGCINSIVDPR